MREISNLELSVLIERLKQVEGSYVDKFYDLGDGRFTLKLSRRDFKANILCILSHTLHMTAYTEKYGEPSNFAVAVRKRIAGYIVNSVTKVNNDRIVKLSLAKGESTVDMVFEMFGKGNLVIVDGTGRVLLAYAYEDFRGRSIKPRSEYKPPENLGTDILACSKDEARGLMQKHGDTGIMSFMSKWTNIGTLYVENAILSLGIGPKETLNDLRSKVWDVINRIKEEEEEAKRGVVRVYLGDDNIVDYALCDIEKYSKARVMTFDDIDKAMDLIYVEKAEKVETLNPAIERLNKSIEKQKRIVAGIDEQIARNKMIAQEIFNNMNVLNEIIDAASNNKRITGEELNALLEGTGLLVKSVDLKNKRVVISVGIGI
ncbi:Fibronectin-binding protein A domain protein [mine drainage metagenome]|uniref:Fibronectin-binding protein A domain protein n=1 Tax=mine drainage metagenome TaxID=410659 RepID=T0YVU5_9ZZZZ